MHQIFASGINVSNSLHDGFTEVFSYVPQIIAALLLLIIGYFIAKGLAGILSKALQKVGFDNQLLKTHAGPYLQKAITSPSHFVSRVVYWLVFIAFVSFAVSALNLPLLNQILYAVYGYMPRVVAALLIFLVASAISAGSAAFVLRVMGKTPFAKMISAAVPAIVLSLAFFMILNELNIARDIVNILFTAIVGALALGFALAFGLGGRSVAEKMLTQAYENGVRNAGSAKAEIRQATYKAKADAAAAKNRADERVQS